LVIKVVMCKALNPDVGVFRHLQIAEEGTKVPKELEKEAMEGEALTIGRWRGGVVGRLVWPWMALVTREPGVGRIVQAQEAEMARRRSKQHTQKDFPGMSSGAV
jgi:hypothetical protein